MTRQTWCLMLSLATCVCWLSACSPTTSKLHCYAWEDRARLDDVKITKDGGWRDGPPHGTEDQIEPPPGPKKSAGQPYPQVVAPALPHGPKVEPPLLPQAVHQPPHPLPTDPPRVQHVPELSVVGATNPAQEKPAQQPVATVVTTPVPPLPPAEEPLVIALSKILKNQPDEALLLLQRYDPHTQKHFMRLLPMLALLEKKGVDRLDADDVTEFQKQLDELSQILRSRAALKIDRMCYCERIDGYGAYQALPEGHQFKAAQGQQVGELVQIYLELRNFASERRENYYETCLASTVELARQVGADRVVVWKRDFQDGKRPLRSLTARNDCFNKYTFYVPPLPEGEYELTIRVIDQTGQPPRAASQSLKFVVARP